MPPLPDNRRFAPIATVCTAGFLLVVVAVLTGWSQALDEALMRAANGAPGWLADVMRSITHLGDPPVRNGFAVLTGLVLVWRRHWLALGALVVNAAGAAAITAILKAGVARPRPEVFTHLTDAGGYSFPSGHAFNGSAVWLAIALALCVLVASDARRRTLLAAGVMIGLVISASRVILGVHWPSDVVAGWLGGTAWTLAVFAIAARRART